jgi:hypothetical protein
MSISHWPMKYSHCVILSTFASHGLLILEVCLWLGVVSWTLPGLLCVVIITPSGHECFLLTYSKLTCEHEKFLLPFCPVHC